jgi:hypothetical protein
MLTKVKTRKNNRVSKTIFVLRKEAKQLLDKATKGAEKMIT